MGLKDGLGGRGCCVWLTGLSGAGKTTTAQALAGLLAADGFNATVLDGDAVRQQQSPALGYSRADRLANVRRIGIMADTVVRRGAIAICAVVSPYRDARDDVRNLIGEGQFLEVFLDTPLAVCEARDVKGLYARARRGEITGLTGIDDPYEVPFAPALVLRAVDCTPADNARLIVTALVARGVLSATEQTA